jgi:hypothetical protein
MGRVKMTNQTHPHKITGFTLPKLGEAESTNQDRFAWQFDGRTQDQRGLRIALADGAGASLYPGQWAEILVQGFCTPDPITAIQQSAEAWLQPLQQAWREYYLAQLQSPQRKWWQGGSAQKPCGYATFLGVWLPDLSPQPQSLPDPPPEQQPAQPPSQPWQAVAVGDSCLFQWVAATQQLQVFPPLTAATFKGTTQCFASLPEYPSSQPQFAQGTYQTGDRFLLATDALAHWLLRDYEQQGETWKQWFEIATAPDFAQEIAHLREQRLIQNDDVTMILL